MRRLGLAIALSILAVVPASAHELKIGDLVIVHPMVDEAEDRQAASRGSLEIRNEGSAPDQLLSIDSEFAEEAEIDGRSPVTIPAKGYATVLLLFRNINRKLSEDEAYAGELTFAKAGKVKIDLMVHTRKH